MVRGAASATPRWLLLIHSIPPQPAYFRAKVGKRLARVGAVAIKNSVYVLPAKDATREDFQWIAREIVQDGGEATVCDATFVEGLQNDHVEALFRAAREADYVQLDEEARSTLQGLGKRPGKRDERTALAQGELARLKKRLGEILAIDFFGAPGREAAQTTIARIEKRLETGPAPEENQPRLTIDDVRGRTWVTRKNVHVDRIASAWLVLRFIDSNAKLKFVPGQGYRAKDDEITFDMFEGTFTHVGDRCTFEVLAENFGLKDPGLRAISEIVHDIDIKDGKFGRPEAPGFATLVAAIALTRRDDDARIAFGGEILDALLELYRRKRTSPEEP
ncbi:MAG TPA: chromate resistance protein ChrB domain-containing protein [Polyangiaceae bacterium]|jgi:hypothetical protein